MKKALCVIFVLILTVSLCSCNDAYNETVITDPKSYDTIWNLPERRVSETSALFPETVEDKRVIDLNCTHTTYQLVGTGWQVELSVKYDNESFNAEKTRLSDLCKSSIVCGSSKYFDTFAYATVWNRNSCFEYAVADENENTVVYVYLQLISKDDLKITGSRIPKEYDMEMSDSRSYSVYEQ